MRRRTTAQPRLHPETASVAREHDHLTRAVVDLDAIAANVRALSDLARPAELMAVIKANAYGHGAAAIAPIALASGATWLGVYAPVEGVALRQAGIEASILVFGPFSREEAGMMVRAGLTPTVASVETAKWLQEAAGKQRVPFHVKLDTGLERAGVAARDAVPFLRQLATLPNLELEGVFTHFASADEPDRTTTASQLDTFRRAIEAIRQASFDPPIIHASNTAGLLDYPEARFSMVRAGIGLYGYYPSNSASRTVPLHPALSLLSTITRVHEVPAGTGVGYGYEHRCAHDSRIALAPIGYGDGLPRSLGNGRGSAIVRGKLVPIIGRISMDQITIDVSDVPGVAVGDRVTVIGADGPTTQTAEDVGAAAGTISYDILTGLLPRVPRIYRHHGSPTGEMNLLSGPRIT
ncbi:MAG: alanine racemase [Chloroflexota bacterium]|nr:alanine racemase [Chloroflexota bacterium]